MFWICIDFPFEFVNTFIRLIVVMGVIHKVDHAYLIRSTWSCYWLDQFPTLTLNTWISSKFSTLYWICLLFILLLLVGAELVRVWHSKFITVENARIYNCYFLFWAEFELNLYIIYFRPQDLTVTRNRQNKLFHVAKKCNKMGEFSQEASV